VKANANSAAPPRPATRVIKLGGSLLDLPDWSTRLNGWLALQPLAINCLVVGGGALVDQMRETPELARRFSQQQIHWLAIRAMAMQAECVLAFLPAARRLDRCRPLAVGRAARAVWIVDAWHFMRVEDSLLADGPLPASWDVTSDSIAARVALATSADELVLLKSTLPKVDATRASAAADGYVDRWFPTAARDALLVRCVDLVDPTGAEQCLPAAAGA
jgi:aspartokinase-like uncharacterized kinase